MSSVESSENDQEELNTPSNPSKPQMGDVYSLLVDGALTRWYDIFIHLGIDRAMLEKSARDHPYNSHLALLDVIVLWLEKEDPPPTWQALSHVLRHKVLEGKIAEKIEKKYISNPSSTNEDRENHQQQQPQHAEEYAQETSHRPNHLSPQIDEDSLEFSKFLLDITDKLSSDSFAALYHCLKELRCPDGTPLLDPGSLKDRRSPDGLLIPLVYTSLCNCRDVDLLVHLLEALHREDLVPIVHAYIPKVGMGTPVVRIVPDVNRFFVVKVFMNEAVRHINLSIVSVIKHDLCVGFGLCDKPYLMQFIGWTTNPICLSFQLPIPCIQFVEERIATIALSNGIEKLSLEINSTTFTYDVMQHEAV